MNRNLDFLVNDTRNKPNTYKNKNIECPFCKFYTDQTENKLITSKGNQMLLENKFPVYSNAHQTVFVENDKCDSNLSNYDEETLLSVLSFGLENWFEMSASEKYASVAFFKNHGLNSGGSITHPHMQLVGLYDIEYKDRLASSDIEGTVIENKDGVLWNISTQPMTEFYEFNVSISKEEVNDYLCTLQNNSFVLFCKYIQKTIHYILNELNQKNGSFNLFFYEFNNQIIVKIIPRGCKFATVTSPYLLGYGIKQVPNNLAEIVAHLKTTH